MNHEMKEALVILKNDNDQLREGLQYVISGGSPVKVAEHFQNRENESLQEKQTPFLPNTKGKTPQSNLYLFDEINDS